MLSEEAENEFEIDIFAERYELLSDSFIDMPRVTASLDRLLPRNCTVFEIGLGTGYFADGLASYGHWVEGIQPPDSMLSRLRARHPNIVVLAEQPLQHYVFTKTYKAIVSHSSVFLFTRHPVAFGDSNEVAETLVFQSFILEPLIVYENLFKTLSAVEPGGKLYVNIQANPKTCVEVGPAGDPLRFEMLDCRYAIDSYRVTKHFRSTFRQRSIVVEDVRYCLQYHDLVARLVNFDVIVSITRDGMWVTMESPR